MNIYLCSHLATVLRSLSAPSLVEILRDESGQDLIEYALVAATIGLGTVAGVNGLASHIANYLSVVDSGFNNSLSGRV